MAADRKFDLQIVLGMVDKASSKFANIQKQINKVGLAATAVATATVAGALAAANAAGKQEQQELSLAQAMRTAGTFTEAAFQHNLEYASSLQRITTFGDETILSVQRLLTNYGAQGDQLDALTKSTLDFATATGMQLEAAAALVGKTIGSTTNALTRYGITVEGAVGSTERMDAAVEGITKLFGGAAEANAQTYAGRVQQLQNRWGDFIETIGFKVIPYIEALINAINTNVLPSLEDWMNATDDTQESAVKFGEILARIIDYARLAVEAFDFLADGLAGLGLALVGQFGAAKEAFSSMQTKFVEFGETVGKVQALELQRTIKTEAVKKELRLANLNELLNVTKTTTKKIGDLHKNIEAGTAGVFNEVLAGSKKIEETVPAVFESVKQSIIKSFSDILASKAVTGVLSLFTGGIGGAVVGGIGSILGFGVGTKGFTGGAAMVGEEGRELAMLPRGTNVIPHARTERILAAAGTGNIVISGNTFVGTGGVEELADIISEIQYNKVRNQRNI